MKRQDTLLIYVYNGYVQTFKIMINANKTSCTYWILIT